MSNALNIILAQINVVVGDVDGNVARIVAAIETSHTKHAADLILFSELALCGYPPEDLLFQAGLRRAIDPAVGKNCCCDARR